MLADTDNLPAMKGAPAPAGGLSAEVANAWKKLNEADGVIPYLDYTTPTFYDDITAAIQELLAGKQDPAAFTEGVQADFDKWAESLAERSAADGSGRTAVRARRAAPRRLPLPAAGVRGLRAVRAAAAAAHDLALVLRRGTG